MKSVLCPTCGCSLVRLQISREQAVRWPHASFGRVAVVAGVGGLAYTVFSEWLNTEIRGSWAYSTWMPVLPVIGTGLAPFLQWIIVPWVAFWWVRPRSGPTDKVRTPMPSS
jgi:hypothetical protein